jgi:hypothetical protein
MHQVMRERLQVVDQQHEVTRLSVGKLAQVVLEGVG